MDRRQFLRDGGVAGLVAALVAAGGWPAQALAEGWDETAFGAKQLDDVFRAWGVESPADSDAIALTAPEIAEHGAVVPLVIASSVPGTDLLAVLVERNPSVLAALFTIPPGTAAEVSTRVKMAQTGPVHVLARAGGRWLRTAREVKITLGGCGG